MLTIMSERDGKEGRATTSSALLSAQELADFLDVPIATIYAWRYHRQGPVGFRVGRHLRYRWIDVEDWIADQLGNGHGR